MTCKNFRIRTKKRTKYYYCTVLRKEIQYSQCSNCEYKEYKQYKTIKSRTNKLAKLERNRYSVFTDDLSTCYLCGQDKQELHEIFAGANRLNSMKYGFVLPLCHNCHSEIQNNVDFNNFWHKEAQLYFEENIGTREEFLKVFRKSWLD